jgi:hypothetical protein
VYLYPISESRWQRSILGGGQRFAEIRHALHATLPQAFYGALLNTSRNYLAGSTIYSAVYAQIYHLQTIAR